MTAVAQRIDLKQIIPERYYEEDEAENLENGSRLVINHDDNFTIATFVSADAGVVSGCSKRNPNEDPMVVERGERIAIVRAYLNFVDKGWQ